MVTGLTDAYNTDNCHNARWKFIHSAQRIHLVTTTEEERDLGMIILGSLSPSRQCAQASEIESTAQNNRKKQIMPGE